MLTVGLTGGIACGKSVVRRRLEERGVPTLDADAVVHRLFTAESDLVEPLAAAFGRGVLAPDGSVDRKALGKIVFDDPSAKAKLEALVHPRVYEAIESFLRDARERGEALAVVDAALMIETGSYRRYDVVLVVHCREDQQLARLMARDGLSREDARKRIDAQMPIEEKVRYADQRIETSGTLEDTLAAVDAWLDATRAGLPG